MNSMDMLNIVEHVDGVDNMDYVNGINNVDADNYCEKLINSKNDLETRYKLNICNNGMVDILNSNSQLENHFDGFKLNNSVFFPHSFITYGVSHINLSNILSPFYDRDIRIQIKIDPILMLNINDYIPRINKSYFFGEPFSSDVFKNRNFNQTVHYEPCDKINDNYPLLYTIFKPSIMDRKQNMGQYYIEEIIVPPNNNDVNFENIQEFPLFGNKYFAQKFIHFTYDIDNGFFEHIDGSVRIFKINEYLDLFNKIKKDRGRTYSNPHIDGVERYKLFKITSNVNSSNNNDKLNHTDIKLIIDYFLSQNNHINEYFLNQQSH